MKYVISVLLALCLALTGLTAFADEPAAAASQPEPSAEPSPTPGPSPTPEPPASADPAPQQAGIYIDNKNLYEKMERTYAQGYVPTVEGGTAYVVLPLLCDGELAGKSLRAKAVLDDSGPFVAKNYEKTVELAKNPVNGGKGKVSGYLVNFPLQLKADRVNGSYPVAVSVSAKDSAGQPVQEDFTVYVTVRDGKDPNATEPPVPEPEPTPEPVVLGPKVLVQACRAAVIGPGGVENGAQDGINAGDQVRVTVTLVNTSQTEALENMAVTAAGPEGFSLLSGTDSVYIGGLAAGATVDVAYEYAVSQETPAGQYAIGLSYDFAYHKGEVGSGTGTARVNIRQPLKMEFALMQVPAEAVISDTVEVNVQAINLSRAKAYNVRAVVEGDGLSPSGTAFIGDLEGGASGEKPLPVLITGLTQGEFPYGQTTGTVTYLYEDSEGGEFSETASFTVNIQSPFSEGGSKEAEDPGQWWIVMAVVGAAALALGGALAFKILKRKRERG